VPNVQWRTPDDGQSDCPKFVEFLDKINLEKLVGFIKNKFVTLYGNMNVKYNSIYALNEVLRKGNIQIQGNYIT